MDASVTAGDGSAFSVLVRRADSSYDVVGMSTQPGYISHLICVNDHPTAKALCGYRNTTPGYDVHWTYRAPLNVTERPEGVCLSCWCWSKMAQSEKLSA